MKNQYIGDIGDYCKYGLLRYLADKGIKIGVNWYMTENDGSKDGKFKDYLKNGQGRELDPELFDKLKDLLDTKGEYVTIENLEELELVPEAAYYNAYIDKDDNRWKWFSESVEVLSDSDLVFLDPDNGIRRLFDRHPGNQNKYIMSDEVNRYFVMGANIVYYCHKGRRKESDWEKYKTLLRDEMYHDCRLIGVTFHKGTQKTFMFVLHPHDYDKYKRLLEEFVDKWQDWATIEPVLLQDEADRQAELFDNNIDNIKKIVLEYSGYGWEFPMYTATIGKHEVEINIEYKFCADKQAEHFKINRESFLKSLRNIHVGKWKASYDNYNILDGYNWSLTVEFNEGTTDTFKSSGSNAEPDNLRKLERLLKRHK